MLFYRDGATATVGTYRFVDGGLTVLTTNGKPDASLPAHWMERARGVHLPGRLLGGEDESTQVFGPLVLLAHNPGARRGAVIGHGSGMSSHELLGSPRLESLVTIEIEPQMIAGSEAFLPANLRVFTDPRARFLIADARSALAASRTRYDLIFSEPSNPWVSGVASLFTVEFYDGVRRRLAPGGVFGQWMHLYEMEDELILGVLAAIDRSFADWSVWVVGTYDILIVAGAAPLGPPDWDVTRFPDVALDLAHAPAPTPGAMASLRILDASTLRPLLRERAANSDFRPVLEGGAERARYLNRIAAGFGSFVADPLDLNRLLRGESFPVEPGQPLTVTLIAPMSRQALAAWLGAGPDRGAPALPEWELDLRRATVFGDAMRAGAPPESWRTWLGQFFQVERALHGRSTGTADSTFYGLARDHARTAPPEIGAAVDLLHGVRTLDLAAAAGAADRLRGLGAGADLLQPELLLDLAVVAYLGEGRAADARATFDALAPRTERGLGHLRNRVLDALIRDAQGDAAP
jgi:hypothetical protein